MFSADDTKLTLRFRKNMVTETKMDKYRKKKYYNKRLVII